MSSYTERAAEQIRRAERIIAALTDPMREAILRLKFETPDELQIKGIEYYQAVIRDGVRTWEEFAAWRERHPVEGIVAWMPDAEPAAR